jgi:DNA-binding MarR family transcriptional regulator
MEELLPLLKSKLKVQILETLKTGNLSPVLLAKKLNRPRPSISRSIIELEQLGFVECTNPEKDRWRIYKITEKGIEVLKKLE